MHHLVDIYMITLSSLCHFWSDVTIFDNNDDNYDDDNDDNNKNNNDQQYQ